jgi:hypothetical protein
MRVCSCSSFSVFLLSCAFGDLIVVIRMGSDLPVLLRWLCGRIQRLIRSGSVSASLCPGTPLPSFSVSSRHILSAVTLPLSPARTGAPDRSPFGRRLALGTAHLTAQSSPTAKTPQHGHPGCRARSQHVPTPSSPRSWGSTAGVGGLGRGSRPKTWGCPCIGPGGLESRLSAECPARRRCECRQWARRYGGSRKLCAGGSDCDTAVACAGVWSL